MMLYVMRHPVEGSRLTLQDYCRGAFAQHLAGLSGGFIWGLGAACTFVPVGMVGIALSYAIGQANPLIAALFGVFVWREFAGSSRHAKVLLTVMFLLYIGGLLSLAASFKAV
jgi:glucose uptake protein